MARKPSRYRPEDDDPYMSREAYPDPYAGVNDDAYEYVGSDAVPDPPPRYEEDPRDSRRRHKSNRASTQPPRSSVNASPPRTRRAASPPARSSRHSDSPPRRRHSRRERDESPPPRLSKQDRGDAAAATAGMPPGTKKNKYGQWVDRPAFKNMKSYGSKGLKTVGNIVEAYAAAQAGGAATERGRAGGRDPYFDKYYEDPYDGPSRRSRRHRTPSPSPSPPRRSTGKRSARDRRRPSLNGRQKSYSMSPEARSRGHDSDEDRQRRRRRNHRHSPSPSPSPSHRGRGRRARSYSHGRDSTVRPTRSKSSRHPHMKHYQDEMKSPNPDVAHRWQLAARAALEAGGVTAFRLRKEPGSWTGQKGAKVVTAALGAAAIDSFIDKDPRRTKPGGVKGMAESLVGGMLASKIMGFPAGSTHKGQPRKY
ncbi:hypothetical protein BKA67DRAFT_659251 [Truncatella angustata]|uniref:Uncharacterized protein n=1 Tax=Truncatella angustata TaxID=152316 RepID=A0A9P8UI85_9PEZI|nr:uncharacterized protein BKA67DRAFT_659251 [Truncatella angustata]KAH6652550.1 hypothetical protein BKA67DRAFT_659251 [Truncatella angustata]KAH8200166.1 hypothetical protein TruAng_005678 [Truncatella angustata]